MDARYTPIADGVPKKGARVEWISPSGLVVRGSYEGGAVWFPERSDMYVYYTPAFWRPLLHNQGSKP